MAITRTTVRLTPIGGGQVLEFDDDGAVSSINVDGLAASTMYTVEAYVYDNVYGTIWADSPATFTTSPQDTGSMEINDMSVFEGEKMIFKATYQMGKYGADTTTFKVRVYDKDNNLLDDFVPTVTGDGFSGALTRAAGIALPDKCEYVGYAVEVVNKGGYTNSAWIDIYLS